jgi:hypothetical protein
MIMPPAKIDLERLFLTESSNEYSTNEDKAEPQRLVRLTAEHFESHCQQVWQRTDRMFAGLMALQWLAGIGVALWIE